MSRDAIEELVHRYSDAVVHRDRDQWAGTWAPDAVWDMGRDRRVEGRTAIAELWTAAMATFAAVVQTCLNGTVDLDEEAGTGTGRWYILEAMRRADGSNDQMIGHYDDTYVRLDGQWHFASRELTVLYRGGIDPDGMFTNAVEL